MPHLYRNTDVSKSHDYILLSKKNTFFENNTEQFDTLGEGPWVAHTMIMLKVGEIKALK